MSYNNKFSEKPFERASKTAHSHIINDSEVKKFLAECSYPPLASEIDSNDFALETLNETAKNPIKTIIAIDGGYTNEIIRSSFPSATFAFLQFGAVYFSYKDLLELKQKAFIDPSDMAKLQNIERFKLAIPTKGIVLQSERDLISSVRKAIYNFFMGNPTNEEETLMTALNWLIFEEFDVTAKVEKWHLSRCPFCDNGVDIVKNTVDKSYTFKCPYCGETLYLTDVFRLHEIMDNEHGASGILGFLTTAIEHTIIVYFIKRLLAIKPILLSEILFIKDGSLAFFGQTANIHKPMRKLIGFLQKKHDIYLVGLEKSGTFAEHAAQVSQKLSDNQIMLLGNKYIYKYIVPGKSEENLPYGSTTYYGQKVIFKAKNDYTYVATIPCEKLVSEPQFGDLKNLDVILRNVAALKCNLYSNSLLPVVLANKLVSLSSHPSSKLLRDFVKGNLGR